MADKQTGAAGSPPDDNGTSKDVNVVIIAAATTGSLGVVAALIYTLANATSLAGWAAFGGAMLVSGAAALAGGVIGFLFAIPRSRQEQRAAAPAPKAVGETTQTRLSDYAANTNLEQISDWLTKILVGISLVEFDGLQRRFSRASTVLAPMLGTAPTARAATIALIGYFGMWGFFVVYLMTRLWLPKALTRAEKEEEVQKRAVEKAAELQALQHEAYSHLYEAPPGGFTRAIQLIESNDDQPGAQSNGWLSLYLASAYGQQHAWIKASSMAATQAGDADRAAALENEAAIVQQKAVNAVKRAIELDPNTRPILEQLYAGTDPNENDLVTLSPALDEILGTRKGGRQE